MGVARAALAVAAVACACGGARQPELLADLTTARDGAAMRSLVSDKITTGGLWFSDAACAREFGEPKQIAADRVDAFAACLAKLNLRASTRKDALPDVVVLDYEPGFEIEARFVDQRITWIGYSARLATDSLPSVSAVALESRRVAGDRDGPVADSDTSARAWLRVCLDDTGGVTSVEPREITSPRVTETFIASVSQWQFKPFDVGGRALAVCAMFHLTHPPSHSVDEHEQLPYPQSGSKDTPILPPSVCESQRLAGSKLIVPDDSTKAAIQEAGPAHRTVGAFRFCIDVTGRPSDVAVLRSTGWRDYDLKIIRTIKDTWRYKPFVVDGAPHAVCTAVTFIYTQH